jgi:hypothetical protein
MTPAKLNSSSTTRTGSSIVRNLFSGPNAKDSDSQDLDDDVNENMSTISDITTPTDIDENDNEEELCDRLKEFLNAYDEISAIADDDDESYLDFMKLHFVTQIAAGDYSEESKLKIAQMILYI